VSEEQGGDEDEGNCFDGSDILMYPCRYDLVSAEEKRAQEIEEIKKRITREKKKGMLDDPLLHYEDETNAEDIFDIPCDDCEEMLMKRHGPNLRSHSQVALPSMLEWSPSDEEEQLGFIAEDDDMVDLSHCH
jgi:hypothetical protein